MKKAFGVALLFAMLAAPAIAGGTGGNGAGTDRVSTDHISSGASQNIWGQPTASFDESRRMEGSPRENPELRTKFPSGTWGVDGFYEPAVRTTCDTPVTLLVPIAAPLDCPLVPRGRGLPF